MTSKSREIIAEGIAEELGINELLREKEKTRSSDIREVIKEELSERYACPECGNDMLNDSEKEEMYCPLGHHSHSL